MGIEIIKGLKDSEIMEIMLKRGYTINDGCDDLKPYVYQAAYDIEFATMKKWREVVRRQNRIIDKLSKEIDELNKRMMPNALLRRWPRPF